MSATQARGMGQVSVEEYSASIVHEFPRLFRQRMVESSISSKTIQDILPINLSSSGKLEAKHLEFRIPGSRGAFIDLSSKLVGKY